MKKVGAVTVLLIAGCALPKYSKGAWPEGIPDESYYARAYLSDARNRQIQRDTDYFDWVIRFYKGHLLVGGWQAQQATLAKLMTPEEFAAVEERMAHLGQIVSAEWAKDNSVRRIDSRILELWGKVLKRASGEHRAGAALDRLTEDAEAILADRLTKAEVTAERYADFLASK